MKAALVSAAAADILVDDEVVVVLERAAADATNPEAGEESKVNPAATSRRRVIDMGGERREGASETGVQWRRHKQTSPVKKTHKNIKMRRKNKN